MEVALRRAGISALEEAAPRAAGIFARLNPLVFIGALLAPTPMGNSEIRPQRGFILPEDADPDRVSEFFRLRLTDPDRAQRVLADIWANRTGVFDPLGLSPLDWSRISPRTGGDTAHHVALNHGSLNLNKPEQGVFYGDPVTVVNQAWQTAQQQGIKPVMIGNRDYYIVPRPNAGFAGGMGGQGQVLDNVTIITEAGTNRAVTAFPSGRTPPMPRNYVPFSGP